MGAFVGACLASIAEAAVLARLEITGTSATALTMRTLFLPLLYVMLASCSASAKKIAMGPRRVRSHAGDR